MQSAPTALDILALWFLFSFILGIATQILDAIIGTQPILYAIAAIGLLLPSLAVAVRRLHDRGKSAWSLLIALIPFIGSIILIIWFIGEGESGENTYGPEPS